MIVLKKRYIKKIFAAFLAAAVMSSFTAVSIYAEPDMVVEDEDDVEFVDEEENPDDYEEDLDEEAEADDTTDIDEEEEDEEGEDPDEDNAGDYPTDEDLVEDETPSLPEPTYTPTGDIKMYASTTINVRKGPGTSYDKLGILYEGSDTTVKGYNGEWMAIDYYGSIGYVLGELLSENAPAAATTTTAPAPAETTPEVIETEDTPVDTEPVAEETASPEIEEEPVITTEEEEKPTTKPADKDKDEDKDNDEAAAITDNNENKPGGLQGILIAAISALVAFILIGVLPIVIHRIHHKKLYQY